MDANGLLRALSQPDRALLSPSLARVTLDRGQILEAIGQPTKFAFFIEAGLAAVVARSPHRQIGIGVIGHDGMTGLELVHDAGRAANETVVQAAGSALSIEGDKLRAALSCSPTLAQVLLRYAHCFMVQASQTALTNGQAQIEERLARWILMSHDRFEDDEMRVTHEYISLMVGVRRAGITVAIHALEGKDLIKSSRDCLRVIDRNGLIALASDSYGICEDEYERLIDHEFRRAA